MRASPCKDCQGHTDICHGQCAKYLEWSRERQEMNEALRKQKEALRSGVYVYKTVDNHWRGKRGRK